MASTFQLFVPEDLLEAEPVTELECSDLEVHVCLQHSESPSHMLGAATTLNIWRRLDRGEIGMDSNSTATILNEKQSVRGGENIRNGAQEAVCTPPLQEDKREQVEEHLQELQDLDQTGQNIIQTEELDEFNDIAVLAEETVEELGELIKDKSVRRRFINWLNNKLEDRTMRKMARTYQREMEEGRQIYISAYGARPTTRARREQQKRQKLRQAADFRQRVMDMLDTYWEKHRHQKEELRLKEEERYEKWMSAHGHSISESSAEEPKKRMSKWKKRFLRAKEFFTSSTN